MPEIIEFETPENVKVGYPLAGLGTRFVAWIIDTILVYVLILLFAVVVLVGGIAGERIMRDLERSFQPGRPGQQNPFSDMPAYLFGMIVLVIGLGNFFYFGVSEFLMRGQTLGKRAVSIRVVKADGFSLDPFSIFLRNIFRVIDQFPVTWLVVLLSKKTQRLGDMAAGTIVVKDAPASIGTLRDQLLERVAADAQFQFPAPVLQRARTADFEAIEKIVERLWALDTFSREKLLESLNVCDPLAKRLQVEPPAPTQRLRFLEDFLAAEYRRQYRQFG